jgi:hypothetical protein
MKIELTDLQFRRLLDMAYIGNWILNSNRGMDRFTDYDYVESFLFSLCPSVGMPSLTDFSCGIAKPSEAFEDGGIHEAISEHENAVFFEILAEELARRDMEFEPTNPEDLDELNDRIERYIDEFEQNGIDNIIFDK